MQGNEGESWRARYTERQKGEDRCDACARNCVHQDDNSDSDNEGEAWDAVDDDDSGKHVDDDDEEDVKPIFMAASEVEAQMRALWREEKTIVARIWGRKFGLGAAAKKAQLDSGYGLGNGIYCYRAHCAAGL